MPREEHLRKARMSRFEWKGDLDDDCSLLTEDGFGAHAEMMSDDEWYCSVWLATRVEGRDVFHSSDDSVAPLTGEAARKLCEFIIDAERYRRDQGIQK